MGGGAYIGYRGLFESGNLLDHLRYMHLENNLQQMLSIVVLKMLALTDLILQK